MCEAEIERICLLAVLVGEVKRQTSKHRSNQQDVAFGCLSFSTFGTFKCFLTIRILENLILYDLNKKSFEESGLIADSIPAWRDTPSLLERRVNNCLDILSVLFTGVEELETVFDNRVSKSDYLPPHSLEKGEEASFGIEPSICSQFLGKGIEALDDARDTKLVVTLDAIEGSDNEIDDREMEGFTIGVTGEQEVG